MGMDRLKKWAFIKASRKGHRRLMLFLLPKVSANAECLMFALHAAVDNNRIREAAILLNAGAPVDAYGNGGFAALHFAADQANQFMIELLLNHGASIDLPTQVNGDTALHLVVGARPKVASLDLQILAATTLINRGANINIQNSVRNTPLHDTVWRTCHGGGVPNPSITRLLLDAQANVLLVNSYNRTPLGWAQYYNMAGMIPMLREAEDVAKSAVVAVTTTI